MKKYIFVIAHEQNAYYVVLYSIKNASDKLGRFEIKCLYSNKAIHESTTTAQAFSAHTPVH